MGITLKVKTTEGARPPKYATPGSSGLDLESNESITIPPKAWRVIPTGLYFEIPVGYEMQIRSRSSLANKGLTVMNQPGTGDSDYRGEMKVILQNHTTKPWHVARGDRVAQAIIAPVARVEVVEVAELDDLSTTERGVGGMGSTGR